MEGKAKTINSIHSGFGCFFFPLRSGNKLIFVEGSVLYSVRAVTYAVLKTPPCFETEMCYISESGQMPGFSKQRK